MISVIIVRMIVDEAEILFKGGHGGPGKVSFFPKEKSGPDGGSGGRGGSVYIKATTDLTALRQFTTKKVIKAENGQPGMSFQKDGKNGADITILMPIGTHITVLNEEEEYELSEPDQLVTICRGGLGGRGNYALRSSRNTTPMRAQPGLPGDEKDCLIELKLIADFGLIGLPNAGKSSLLNELTRASAKVGDFPFTTLEPNLGVFNQKIIADIPGLIEGASLGKGLGTKFLKHIEKVSVLLHVIAADSEDVVRDYNIVRQELEKYNPDLLERKEILLLTKSDLMDETELSRKITTLKKMKKNVYPLSIYNWNQIEHLKTVLAKDR